MILTVIRLLAILEIAFLACCSFCCCADLRACIEYIHFIYVSVLEKYNEEIQYLYVNELIYLKNCQKLTYLKFEAEWACTWPIVSSV